MRFHLTPPSLLHLITAFLLAPTPVVCGPHPALSSQAGFNFNELVARWDCGGTYCGYSSQLCCSAGSTCYTDGANQAQCGPAVAAATQATGLYVYTTTYVQTDLSTVTKVISEYLGASSAPATATMSCDEKSGQSTCGTICCASGQYCYSPGQSKCKSAKNGSSSSLSVVTITPAMTGGETATETATDTAGAPILPTSSSTLVVTETTSPTETVPFETPVATGANITLTSNHHSGGGSHLSGGAIAGIVIGVLLGLALLGLLCFCCCVKGLLDGLLALFGFGKKKRRTEVDEYERRSHNGRTWYGAAKPSRPSRYDDNSSRSSEHKGRKLLGMGAALAGLWAILGLKRKRDHRNEEKYSEYSYGSSYYDTSASSASSDRRTRESRRSRSRVSRR